jgi:hypothetical protein
MAMLDPSDREEDRLAGRRSLYVIGGLSLIMVVLMVLVVAYYYGTAF